jgi:hypothetical protein
VAHFIFWIADFSGGMLWNSGAPLPPIGKADGLHAIAAAIFPVSALSLRAHTRVYALTRRKDETPLTISLRDRRSRKTRTLHFT